METLVIPLRLVAVVMMTAGALALQHAWANRGATKFSVAAGWVLIALSIFVWGQTSGADRGTALGLVMLVVTFSTAIAVRVMKSPTRSAHGKAGRSVPPTTTAGLGRLGWMRRVFVGFLVGPLAGLAALSVTTIVYAALDAGGAEPGGNLVVAFFVFPLSWAALSVVNGYDEKLWRKTSLTAAAGILPLLGLAALS
ncbi:MAG: hypothetical protein AAGI89_13600 [Pseudomonadota bacterium]